MKIIALLSIFFMTTLSAAEDNAKATLNPNPSDKDYASPGSQHKPDGKKDHVFKGHP